MDDLAGVLAYLAAIGLTFCAISFASVQPTWSPEFSHPRPQVELRPAPPKAMAVSAVSKHEPKQRGIEVTRQSRQMARVSKEASNARAEELPIPAWSPTDFR
jgi:hypothetical protein